MMVRRLLITAAAAASSTGTRASSFLAWAHHHRASPTTISSAFVRLRPFTTTNPLAPPPSSSSSSSAASPKTSRKRARPVFPEALSTVERMQLLRAQARMEKDGEADDASSEAPPPSPSAHHNATILKWLQDLVIGYKLCPWAAPALNAQAVKILVHPEEANLETLIEATVNEASLLASMPDGPEGRNLTTLIGVPGPLLEDFQDFLDLAGTVDECLDELDLRGKVQLASFHPDYRFADATPGADVENFTNRSPMPVLHLLREVEVSRALEGYVGDPARIYERNKAAMREAGAEKLKRLIAACHQQQAPHK